MSTKPLPIDLGYEVYKMRRKRMSWRTIADKLEISNFGARSVYERAMQEMRSDENMQKRLSEFECKELVRMKDGGLSFTDIAKILSVTPSAVSRMYTKITDPDQYAEMMRKNREGIQARKEANKGKGKGNKIDMFAYEYEGADWSRAHKAVFGSSAVMKELSNV